MQKVKIITDSSCDLDIDYLNEIGVEMSPLVTILEDGDFLDRVEITPGEFYKKLKNIKKLPTTSQSTPASFYKLFKEAIDNDMEVVCIAFSSKLSGTYQSAIIAKEMLNNDERVEVIDSLAASVGQGLIVEKAAFMAREGKNKDEIINEVIRMRGKMEHIIGVGSLDMLKLGGRISASQAVIGNLLSVKPILHFVDGAIFPLDKTRGKKGLIKKLIQILEEKGEDIKSNRIGISYSEDLEFARELENEIKEKLGIDNILISEIGSVIGSHVGPSTIALFFIRK
ncbi:DegV family protein [Clostridium cylindrosporum]|uniref:EDD domain protein, DegV family n=1 Tax=Clostridium cylindrosporum DSM 605 TaxID=1121307 RepID=A0A0J8DAC0_CLOCY|nr:DegV family protein [Clostridium cylindrosporum]KMT21248.1 EDD domain protein, DegV family [Clostridium cylindrosporum DSM 605]